MGFHTSQKLIRDSGICPLNVPIPTVRELYLPSLLIADSLNHWIVSIFLNSKSYLLNWQLFFWVFCRGWPNADVGIQESHYENDCSYKYDKFIQCSIKLYFWTQPILIIEHEISPVGVLWFPVLRHDVHPDVNHPDNWYTYDHKQKHHSNYAQGLIWLCCKGI